MRRNDVDIYKGILVWFVVISHIMALSEWASNTFVFRLITNSHIPLFMGISGFLFNPNKIINFKLLRRLLLPWMMANFVYFLLKSASFDMRGIVFGFETHLWYIPSIIFFMMYIYIIEKLVGEGTRNLIVLALIFVISLVFPFSEILFTGDTMAVKLIRFVCSNFRLQFLVYFMTGYLSKKFSITVLHNKLWVIAGVVILLLAGITSNPVFWIIRIIGNVMLIVGLLTDITEIKLDNKMIKFFHISGKNSMFIYLWHVVPLTLSMPIESKLIIMLIWLIVLSFVMLKNVRKMPFLGLE